MNERLPTLRYYRDERGDWRWSLVAANGNFIAASTEGYRRKLDCVRSWEITRGPLAGIVEVTKAGEVVPMTDPQLVKRAIETLESAERGPDGMVVTTGERSRGQA